MAQTKHPRTNWETSRAILGHQYRAWRSERVSWLPGCPEPGEACGPPGGAGSLRVLPGPTGWGSRGRLVEELVLEWRALKECEYRRGSPP